MNVTPLVIEPEFVETINFFPFYFLFFFPKLGNFCCSLFQLVAYFLYLLHPVLEFIYSVFYFGSYIFQFFILFIKFSEEGERVWWGRVEEEGKSKSEAGSTPSGEPNVLLSFTTLRS